MLLVSRPARITDLFQPALTLASLTLARVCCRVTKVRQFQKLSLMRTVDGQMQQRLKQLLKLSKEKWDSACEHAKTAVQVCLQASRSRLQQLLHEP